MLGQMLAQEAISRGHKATTVARNGCDYDLDISHLTELADFLKRTAPKTIINSAAMISLAACEEQPQLAEITNGRAVGVMAEYCNLSNASLIQISTDQYFKSNNPKKMHDENAEINLVNSYARTKYSGENFALKAAKSIVVRTNVTGCRNANGPTFLEWAVAALTSAQEITGFNDYYTSTIDRVSLAKAIFDLVDKQPKNGIYNIGSSDVCNKFDFLTALSKELGLLNRKIKNGTVSTSWPDRCITSGLDVRKAEVVLGYKLPGLSDVIKNLIIDYRKCWPSE